MVSQDSIPWKWSAYEFLENRAISVTSDVWSFGITAWEIYSLGEVPYAGLDWSSDFISQLKTGLRLDIPTLSTPEMYADYVPLIYKSGSNLFIYRMGVRYQKCMLSCWCVNPRERPTFTTLKRILADYIATNEHCM